MRVVNIIINNRYHSTKVTPKCRSSDRSVRTALLAYMAARVYFQNIPGTISQFQKGNPTNENHQYRHMIIIIITTISSSRHHH